MKASNRIFFILLFSTIFINTFYSQQYWLRQPSPTGKWLSKCMFTDSLYGWATGDSGIVIHTSDGGINWVVQNSNAGPNYINDVFFLNRRLGWALANDFSTNGTFVMKTTNSGETWNSSRFYDSTLYLKTVYYLDSLAGYMGTFGGEILKTTDAGLSWNMCSIETGACYSFSMNKINFINAQTGYICGGSVDLTGEIWRTTNSGLNWKPYCVALEPLIDIKFNNGKIIATGGDYEYGSITVESNNGGIQWNYSSNGFFGIGQTLAFRTPAEVWVPLGFSGLWCVSNDSGLGGSWHSIPAPDTSLIYAAQFNSPTNGWAFGTGGAIYKYNTGVIGITNNHNNVPYQNMLYQNYPNPFNPSTKIRFAIGRDIVQRTPSENASPSDTRSVSLRIYDALGRQVVTLVNDKLMPGTYQVDWESNGFASGIYFYSLSAGDFTDTKRMVLIK